MSSTQVTGSSSNITVSGGGGEAGAGGDFAEVIDFGDLSTGNGQPVVGSVGVRVKGNANYNVTISQMSFTAKDLQVANKDVSGSGDQGSFITVRVGSHSGSGSRANPGQTKVNGQLNGGMRLSQVSYGPVTAESTRVAGGGPPSTGGTMNSSDNAVDIPVYFSVPTGLEIGPAPGASTGSFQATIQLGIFAGS
jgi:hypothetical protein